MKGKLKFPRVLECEIYWPSEYRVDLSSIKANLLELFRSKRMKKKNILQHFFLFYDHKLVEIESEEKNCAVLAKMYRCRCIEYSR